jgi:hypothetical protein
VIVGCIVAGIAGVLVMALFLPRRGSVTPSSEEAEEDKAAASKGNVDVVKPEDKSKRSMV